MRTEKTTKSQFCDMNAADLHASSCYYKSRSFENLDENSDSLLSNALIATAN